jgi:GMP synthase-like glutamine amidotransferase
MRVGLLVCDHVDPGLLDVAGDYTDMFRALLEPAGIEVVPYDLAEGEVPGSVRECDGWITTGSRRHVHETGVPWIRVMADLVREFRREDRPFVGVCFGHQMIAHALGGEVAPAAAGWGVGRKDVVISDVPGWMDAASFPIMNSHVDEITRLPPGASAIGGDEHCRNAMIRLGPRMIGMQGHPEFGVDYARALIRARRGTVVPHAVADAALEALPPAVDTARFGSWLGGFFSAPGSWDDSGGRRPAEGSRPGE